MLYKSTYLYIYPSPCPPLYCYILFIIIGYTFSVDKWLDSVSDSQVLKVTAHSSAVILLPVLKVRRPMWAGLRANLSTYSRQPRQVSWFRRHRCVVRFYLVLFFDWLIYQLFWFVGSFSHLSSIRWVIHSFVHLFSLFIPHSFIHSFIYLFTFSVTSCNPRQNPHIITSFFAAVYGSVRVTILLRGSDKVGSLG